MMGVYVRQGDRLGCCHDCLGYSALKKAGLLVRQYCMKCGYRCWIYLGQRYRYLEVSHNL